ncbi:LysR substrate-binding domain-containing protein [Kribbella hippodromi]|uniref:LysR substrate-binding domain-containing protein n=1 Tax=Kribbella hippodromi TaxID=434347 RepID=A0ABP4PYP2_9ACTN
MRYDLDDLRLFTNVAAEGSITGGARMMHLSLPSASARVRALEAQAGVPLLVRERRGVRLTPAGATLARHARDVLAQTIRLDSAVASYAVARTAPIRLVAGGSAMHQLVPLALATFLRDHPEYDVNVAERRTVRSVRLLAAGEADLGVILDDEPTELRTEPLADDSLVVIGQSGGILSGRASIAYAEVAEHPLVGLDRHSPLSQWMDERLGRHAPAPRYRTLVPTLHALITLATAGAGLAVVPRRAVHSNADVDICPLQDAWSTRGHLLCYATDAPESVHLLAEHLHLAASVPT